LLPHGNLLRCVMCQIVQNQLHNVLNARTRLGEDPIWDAKEQLLQGATIITKLSQIKVLEVQTPGKNRLLIENELYEGSRLFCGDQFCGEKERSRNLTKTVIIMLASFYQNFLEKYLNKAQLITLKMLVWLIQNQKQVKIETEHPLSADILKQQVNH
jgi:hypothetical protein